MVTYDVLVVGGGLSGAVIARALAQAGVRVLVVERDREYRDRVRGEQMQPWGVEEARMLGVYDLLREGCGHEQPWVDMFLGPQQIAHRNLVATTAQKAPHFNFFHPRMQQILVEAATSAGAEVWRGATVTDVTTGRMPSAVVERDGRREDVTCQLIVGADGRISEARHWGRFDVQKDPPFLMIAGVLVDDMPIRDDTGLLFMNPDVSQGAYLFPQGGGRVRAYSAYPVTAEYRLQGEKDLPRFIAQSVNAGAPRAIYDGVKAAGPLASFEATDTWVNHPYADRMVLVGDAAASNDPSWGQGLSITLRDVRVLRDRLLESADWDAACHEYADEHDRHYGVIHEVTLAYKEMFLRSGSEADARRARALPLMAQDPGRVPDQLFGGPDLPWNAGIRRRFFAEDTVTS